MSVDAQGNLSVDIDRLSIELERIQLQGGRVVIFGYTYVLYAYAAKELLERGIRFSLPDCSILHIGGMLGRVAMQLGSGR